MGVFGGRLRQFMPQQPANGRQRYIMPDGDLGIAVAQIMDPQIRQSATTTEFVPPNVQPERRIALRIGKDKWTALPARQSFQNLNRLAAQPDRLGSGLATTNLLAPRAGVEQQADDRDLRRVGLLCLAQRQPKRPILKWAEKPLHRLALEARSSPAWVAPLAQIPQRLGIFQHRGQNRRAAVGFGLILLRAFIPQA
ncbi:hypothetical protein E4T56_gene7765, partial [Termitomyces sp. T112]